MTLEEINNSFQEYQDDLAVRELHLKPIFHFSDDHQDDLFALLKELRNSTPILFDPDHKPQGETTEQQP